MKINGKLLLLAVFSAFVFETSALNIANCSRTIVQAVCNNKEFCASISGKEMDGFIKEALSKCKNKRISLATKVFGIVSMVTSATLIARKVLTERFPSCRRVTERNKLVRFLSGDIISYTITTLGMALSIISLTGLFEESEVWFWLSKGIGAFPRKFIRPADMPGQ